MPSNYYELYFPVLVQAIVALAVAVGLVGGGLLLGKRVRNAAKDTPYESGMRPIGSARERFSVKFYLVAMVFILFDIEAIFLYPWAVVFRELAQVSRLFPFIEMLLFIVLVLVGFFYIWKKGVLDWSQEAMDEFRSEERASPKLSGRGFTLVEDK
jgi:NADH-quinone oxidoreductase subunit A